MEIRQLEYFMEVARQKNFSKAAEVLHISQPSISKAVRDLEGEMGVTLFHRNTKSVELTDNGEAILEQVQHIIASVQTIAVKLTKVSALHTGKIHIGLPPITGVTALANVLGDFKKQFPNIEINLYEFGSKKIENAILEGCLDLGVIFIPCSDYEMFEIIPLVEEPLYLVVHHEHRLAQRDQIDYCDLANERLVFYNNDFGLHDVIMNRFKQAGVTPSVMFKTSQLELMSQVITAGLGAAFLPQRVCMAMNQSKIVYLPVSDFELSLKLAIAWKKRRYVSYAARQLLDYLNSHLVGNIE